MKKFFLLCALFACATGFSQVMDIFNNSSKAMSVTVYAYGTNAPYNTCASLIHTSFSVSAATVNWCSFASGTWRDSSNAIVTPSSWGNPVFVRVEYNYVCGSGSIPPPRAYAMLQNSLCGGTSQFSASSGCNVTGTWTVVSPDVAITIDD